MIKFRYINDLTSDVMFEAYGMNLKELFNNAATAMFTIFCKIDRVMPKKKILVEIKGQNKEELMKAWLQELIALVDIEEKFFSRFDIIKIDEQHLKAEIYGETISPEKGNTVVKAVTNYGFEMGKKGKKLFVRFSLDI